MSSIVVSLKFLILKPSQISQSLTDCGGCQFGLTFCFDGVRVLVELCQLL